MLDKRILLIFLILLVIIFYNDKNMSVLIEVYHFIRSFDVSHFLFYYFITGLGFTSFLAFMLVPSTQKAFSVLLLLYCHMHFCNNIKKLPNYNFNAPCLKNAFFKWSISLPDLISSPVYNETCIEVLIFFVAFTLKSTVKTDYLPAWLWDN